MAEERWRDIPEFKGLYRMSNRGRCWNIKEGRLIEPNLNNRGDLFYQLQIKTGKRVSRGVKKLYSSVWPKAKAPKFDRNWAVRVKKSIGMRNYNPVPAKNVQDPFNDISFTPGCEGVNDLNYNPLR